MSVEDVLAALYNDPQSGYAIAASASNPLDQSLPGGLYQNLGPAPSSQATSGLTNDQTTQATPQITNINQLLSAVYGFNPFADTGPAKGKTVHQMVSDLPPLQGIPLQFAQAVVEEMLRQNQNIQDASVLTDRIQQLWNSPQVKDMNALLTSQGASPATLASSLANVVKYGNQQVPAPFNPAFIGNVSQAFGQNGEVGVDIAMGQGNTLVAPMAGTVTEIQRYGQNGSPWNYVRVQLDNGWSYAIGHLSFVNVMPGQRINPGSLLGTSGGVVGQDTAPGHSTGPHIEYQLIDPRGHYVNPYPFLQQLMKGASFGSLMAQFGSGIYGAGITIAQQRLMQQGIYDPELHTFYERANTVFRTYFGREPTDQELIDIVGHGNDEASIETYVRSMPSHVPGIAMGDYTDLRKIANSVSQKIYGHDSNDQIVKSLYDSQATTPSAVNFYYSQLPFQPGKDVSPIIYDQVYKSAAAYSQAVWNQEPHPVDLQAIYNAAGGTGQASTPPSDTKASLNAAA